MLLIVWMILCGDLGLQVPDQLRGGFAGEILKVGSLEAGKQDSDVLLPDSLLVWSGHKALGIAPGLPDQCRNFAVLILSQPERHLALSVSALPLPLPSANTGAGGFAASLLSFRSPRQPRGKLPPPTCIRRLSRRSAAPEQWLASQPVQPASLPVLHPFGLRQSPCR